MKIPLGAIAALILTLSAAAQTPPKSFSWESKGDQLVHEPSKFAFPKTIGVFQRDRAVEYDTTGRNVSVGYNAGVAIAATIYLYPAGGQSLESEFSRIKSEIIAAHPGAKVLTEGDTSVSRLNAPARVASFTFSDRFAGESQELYSVLVVSRYRNLIVKYRFTYPDLRKDRAEEEIKEFLRAFSWP